MSPCSCLTDVITDKLWRQFKVEYLGVYTSPGKTTEVPAPIVRYINNPLEACRIPSIQLHLEPNTTFTSISEGLAFEIKVSFSAENLTGVCIN